MLQFDRGDNFLIHSKQSSASDLAVITRIIILSGLLVLLPAGVSAQSFSLPSFSAPSFSTSNIYVAGFLDRFALDVESSSNELEPLVATAAVGYWVLEGVGLELDLGTGVTDDSIGSLDVDLRSKVGLSLRFESPPAERFAVYASFGFVRTSYRAEFGGVSSTLSLPGGRLALGFTYAIRPQFVFDGAFTHHDLDGDARINSFRVGVRYDFGS